ncbi:MAG: nucleotide exchange factor GrpE [Candidatus Diapherotrites archaeon]|nr:nucleotide exchange factor GrpE [Candidatus Diapherotrites archaeon]
MQPHKKEEKTPQEHQKEGKEAFEARLVELEKRLAEEKEKAGQFREIAQRVQAEFENFAKRTEKEKAEHENIAGAGVIASLLPVLDSLDSAIFTMEKHGKTEKDEGLHGLVLLRKQLFSVLEKDGLRPIEAVGKKFDPSMHECFLSAHENGKEDEIVLEEIQKGYTLNSLLLRPSKVKINKVQEKKGE